MRSLIKGIVYYLSISIKLVIISESRIYYKTNIIFMLMDIHFISYRIMDDQNLKKNEFVLISWSKSFN